MADIINASGEENNNQQTGDKTKDAAENKVQVTDKVYEDFLISDPSIEDLDRVSEKLKSGTLTDDDLKKSEPVKPDDDPNKGKTADEIAAAKVEADKIAAEKVEQTKREKDRELVKITDEYINSAPPEEQQFLRGIKDTSIANLALRNYISAQKKLEEQKTALEEFKANISSGAAAKQADDLASKIVIDQSKITDTIKKQKMEHVVKELRGKFDDLPAEAATDPEVLKEYMDGLTHSQFEDFKAERTKIEARADRDIAEYIDLSENHEKYAADTVAKDVKKFEDYLTKKGLKVADLGLDLSIDIEKKNPYLLNIIAPQGKASEQHIRYVRGDIPWVIPGTVYNSLIDLNDSKITELIVRKAHEAGYKAKIGDYPDPSMAGSGTAGEHIQRDLDPNSVVVKDDDTLEVIDQKMNRLKRNIVENFS